jgi:GT2 family glycosyltransferase
LICLSVVSHGQGAVASRLLDSIERTAIAARAAGTTSPVSQVIYTRNVAEADGVSVRSALPGLTVIDNRSPRGFGENHNAAFQHCQAPYFCVVNPDIEWARDPFPALLACFGDSGDASAPSASNGRRKGSPIPRPLATPQARHARGLVAPLVLSPDGTIENTARTLYTVREMLVQKLRPTNRGADAHWLAGMFLLFRSDAYGQIGGFDERYFLYIEDVDICSRLRLAGWTLAQCPEASVVHDARNASHRSPRYMLWHLAGMVRYWRSSAFWRYRALLARESRG